MKETTSRYHADAAAAGVKIVHCCGWDCIPADLGALLVAQYAQDKLGRSAAPLDASKEGPKKAWSSENEDCIACASV